MFLCEGVAVLYRVCLVIFKDSFKNYKPSEYPSLHELNEVLQNFGLAITDDNLFVSRV